MDKPAAAELPRGSRFRGLLIQNVLGRGAMGIAHLASHPVLRMPLVVKTFAPEEGDPFREAHLAARVRSAFVVDVVDAGWEEGEPFVVHEYVDGIDLQELCDHFATYQERLAPGLVVRIVRDLAMGLHAVHQAGVLHRDLKPANGFLSGAGHALVGDFGIAVDPTTAKHERRRAGTPHFVAPEIWLGKPAGPASDLYALGATAHLLATGKPPFEGATMEQLVYQHIQAPYEPPATRDPVLAYLFALVRQMLAKEPGARPSSADEVADGLARLSLPLADWAVTGPRSGSVGGLHVELSAGNIAETEADLIVSAANWQLAMDVGVAAALVERGGPSIEEEAQAQAPAGLGDVVITRAGTLDAEWVAHAVAAMTGGICIQRCVLRTLLEARARGVETVALPALGTGVGEVPHPLGAKLTLEAIRTFAQVGRGSVGRIDILLYDEPALTIWEHGLASA